MLYSDGEVERGDTVRIIRDGRIIYTGKIDSSTDLRKMQKSCCRL